MGNINTPQIPPELERFLPKSKFLVAGGTGELQIKLDIAMHVGKFTAPDRWTVVTRAQLDPSQFPALLLKRFPGKEFFVIYTLESFLPDVDYGNEDVRRIFENCAELCEKESIRIYAIVNDPSDDEWWRSVTLTVSPRVN